MKEFDVNSMMHSHNKRGQDIIMMFAGGFKGTAKPNQLKIIAFLDWFSNCDDLQHLSDAQDGIMKFIKWFKNISSEDKREIIAFCKYIKASPGVLFYQIIRAPKETSSDKPKS